MKTLLPSPAAIDVAVARAGVRLRISSNRRGRSPVRSGIIFNR